MTIQCSTAEAWKTRVRYIPIPGEPGVWSTSYIGAVVSHGKPEQVDEGDMYPVAYLVEFDPDTLIRPHFHVADQFQLVVSGSGTFGNKKLDSVSFHYSSAYTTYGPICAKEDGLSYFTLRNGWDAGASWMPEERERQRAAKRPRREVVAEAVSQIAEAELAKLSQTECIEMLSETDGLGGWIWRLPPGGRAKGPAPDTGRGQYWVVLGGALASPGGALERWSCTWVSPDDAPFEANAAESGLELILLQFPRH